ncbi:hypothetical protein H6763_04175 [Candidatus Nomurabacteria bacterium]|uniref:Uncharacterized protein n=1 Tax=Candidatus Dojkabacteria bacterium TaxID=2099670 RepID=A0A955KWV7_9BACT|nr:hypothetical protein [Candidatus Dojkabacteria bacterium]MCB9789664.1 hypothetical protein [Candidatus Nomurabacteria bacterium]MCB9803995.1 hypothetical protein [Candidatus Nomurabacteria bacterium]
MLKISFLPAAIMIVSKVFGLYLAIVAYDMQIFIDNEIQFPFTVQLLINERDNVILANSISDLVLLLVMTSICAYIYLRFTLYTRSADDPRTIVKLTKLNLVKWITDKNSVFLKVFVWVLFLLASDAVIIANTLRGETYSWIGVTAFVTGILFMWALVRTFEMEIEKLYPTDKNSLY